MRKEHGAVLNSDGTQVATTTQCPHCSAHFVMVRGSGRKRGYCLNCNAVTCGAPACDVCVPVDERLNYLTGQKVPQKYLDRLIELPSVFGG